jgi:hypothetical protein
MVRKYTKEQEREDEPLEGMIAFRRFMNSTL